LGLGESIKRDHDVYRRFFAKMARSTPEDAPIRNALLTDITQKITVHHEAEEQTLFPRLMQIPEFKCLILELTAEHEDFKRLFKALQTIPSNTEVWKYKLASIYDIMHAHWLKEEERLTPFCLDYFTEAEWADFGRCFEKITAKKLSSLALVVEDEQVV